MSIDLLDRKPEDVLLTLSDGSVWECSATFQDEGPVEPEDVTAIFPNGVTCTFTVDWKRRRLWRVRLGRLCARLRRFVGVSWRFTWFWLKAMWLSDLHMGEIYLRRMRGQSGSPTDMADGRGDTGPR